MDVRRHLTRAGILAVLVAACAGTGSTDYGEDAYPITGRDDSGTTTTDAPPARDEARRGPPGGHGRHGPPCELDAVTGRLVPRTMDETQRPSPPPEDAPRFNPLSCEHPDGLGPPRDDDRPPPDATADAGDMPRRRLHGPPPHALIGFVYDIDDSGTLDDTEKATLQADLAAHCDAMTDRLLEEADTDTSGTLSEDELETARAAREADRPAPPASEEDGRQRCELRRAALVERFDTDCDGAVAGDELATLRADARERFRTATPPPQP